MAFPIADTLKERGVSLCCSLKLRHDRYGSSRRLHFGGAACLHQHFEEDRKRSIEVGMLADLVMLVENPLTADSDRLLAIKAVETIKEGQTVYRAS